MHNTTLGVVIGRYDFASLMVSSEGSEAGSSCSLKTQEEGPLVWFSVSGNKTESFKLESHRAEQWSLITTVV